MKFPPNHSLKKSISNESNYSIIRIKRVHQERFLKYHHLTLLNQIQDYSTQVRNHVPSTHLYASDRALKICKSRRQSSGPIFYREPVHDELNRSSRSFRDLEQSRYAAHLTRPFHFFMSPTLPPSFCTDRNISCSCRRNWTGRLIKPTMSHHIPVTFQPENAN